MKLCDLRNVSNIRILRELISLEKYNEISNEYKFLLDHNQYKDSGANLVYNIECLNEIFSQRNFGECIEVLDALINGLNSRMFKVKCNQKWENLLITKDKNVRFCTDCSRHVFEVKNEIEFIKRKHLQQCLFFNSQLTDEISNGICIVEGEHEEDLGMMPFIETGEDQNDHLFPFKKQ